MYTGLRYFVYDAVQISLLTTWQVYHYWQEMAVVC